MIYGDNLSMKKFASVFILLIFAAGAVCAQEKVEDLLLQVIPEDFCCREFFAKNPLWADTTLSIENLDHFKGKILHTKNERYTLSEDGTKGYGNCDGFPTEDRYLIFDSDGVIRFSCNIEVQSGWEAGKKRLTYTEYKYTEGCCQTIEHTPNAETGIYSERYIVEKHQDGSVVLYDETAGFGKRPVYSFQNENGTLVYVDSRFESETRKLTFSNEYMKKRASRNVETPRLSIKNDPLGFQADYYSHPAEIGKPGNYCHRTTELLDAPDDLLAESFGFLLKN